MANPPRDLNRLLAAAKHHVRAARAAANSTSEFALVDAPIHAGAAIELFAKLVLIQFHPRLVSHSADTSHALLDIVAHSTGSFVKSRPAKARTVDAGIAVELAARLCPGVSNHLVAIENALKARNAAVHIADPDLNPEATLAATDLFADACLNHLGRADPSLISADRLRAIEDRNAAYAAEVRSKVEVAQRSFRDLTERLEGNDRQQVVALLIQRADQQPGEDGWEVECPSCDYEAAWLSWYADYEYEFDGATAHLSLGGLDCPRCGLELDDQEVEALGIDTADPREPDFDEDHWRESRYED